MLAEQPHGEHEQVVEVDGRRLVRAGAGTRCRPRRCGARPGRPPSPRTRRGRISSFFSALICAWSWRGREPLRIEVEVAAHPVGEAHGVGLVVDREARPVAEQRRLAAQDPRARGVERRHPHAVARPGRRAAATRSRISPAALLVNVIARISNGDAPSSATRYARRCVSTRVLPEPAPAIDEHRARRQRDGLVLGRIQPREIEAPACRPGGRDGRASVSTMTHASYRGRITRVSARRLGTSTNSVTGPSLTSATCMSARKRPVATGTPRRAQRSRRTPRPAARRCSGRAAATQLGRRPRAVSP